MSVAGQRSMSMAEFLAWEERQEFKYELDGLKPVATNGVTWAHSTIQRNVLAFFTGSEASRAERTVATSGSKSSGEFAIRMLSWSANQVSASTRSSPIRWFDRLRYSLQNSGPAHQSGHDDRADSRQPENMRTSATRRPRYPVPQHLPVSPPHADAECGSEPGGASNAPAHTAHPASGSTRYRATA